MPQVIGYGMGPTESPAVEVVLPGPLIVSAPSHACAGTRGAWPAQPSPRGAPRAADAYGAHAGFRLLAGRFCTTLTSACTFGGGEICQHIIHPKK